MRIRGRLTLNMADIARIGIRQYLGNGRDYAGVASRARDVRPAWNAVRDIFFKAETDVFDNFGRTSEHPQWEANNPDYAEWKAEKFSVALYSPLELTGRLRRQITGVSGGHFERAEPKRYEIGTNAPVSSWSGKSEGISLDAPGEDVGGLNAEGDSQFMFPPRSKKRLTAKSREVIRITQKNIDDFSDVLVDYVFNVQPGGARRRGAQGRMYRNMASGNRRLAGRATHYERL